MKIAIINGPNLNLLGRRDPEHYGTASMEQVLTALQRRRPDVYFTYYQSNHEGDLIDRLQATLIQDEQTTAPLYDGIILNAGGYSHTSVALRDAVELCTVPVVEVHISNIYAREPFRRTSLLTDVCAHSIIGHGTSGYEEAVVWIEQYLRNNNA
ncbi:MAG: 3-dehydroquinate dehydratase [Paludibacteraceae bacterium]|nr:3-dehydroquinate dehydratase [Paludibacteraceae bacterium]